MLLYVCFAHLTGFAVRIDATSSVTANRNIHVEFDSRKSGGGIYMDALLVCFLQPQFPQCTRVR